MGEGQVRTTRTSLCCFEMTPAPRHGCHCGNAAAQALSGRLPPLLLSALLVALLSLLSLPPVRAQVACGGSTGVPCSSPSLPPPPPPSPPSPPPYDPCHSTRRRGRMLLRGGKGGGGSSSGGGSDGCPHELTKTEIIIIAVTVPVGTLLLAALITVIIVVMCRRRRKQIQSYPAQQDPAAKPSTGVDGQTPPTVVALYQPTDPHIKQPYPQKPPTQMYQQPPYQPQTYQQPPYQQQTYQQQPYQQQYPAVST